MNNLTWQQLIIHVSDHNAETISEQLNELGALAVTLMADNDEKIYEPPLSQTPLWHHSKICALFTEDTDLSPIIAHLTDLYPDLNYSISELADQVWERVWLDQFKPLQFGDRLWIVPTQYTPPQDQPYVILDPGLAFGTGTHPTTALCLTWLAQHLQAGQTVLDYGCGSGILSLAAVKLKAQKVFAVDHDSQALLATEANRQKNDIAAEQLITSLPENLSCPLVDIVVANILASTLVALAKQLAAMVKPSGIILLSGILASQRDEIINTYAQWFSFATKEILQQDEWLCLVGHKHQA